MATHGIAVEADTAEIQHVGVQQEGDQGQIPELQQLSVEAPTFQPPPHMDMQQQLMALLQQQQDMQKDQMTQMREMHRENLNLRQALDTANQVQSTTANVTLKRPSIARPVVDLDLSESGWTAFLDSWDRYKAMSKLSDPNVIRDELRVACSKEINNLLLSFVGPDTLKSINEEQLLQHIKSVSVRTVHKEVHRQHFVKMVQAEGELLTHFIARLRSQAALCGFIVMYPPLNENSAASSTPPVTPSIAVSYAEEMVSNQMISGLRNPEHQTRLLADVASLQSFQSKFDKLMSLEMTDKSTPHLSLNNGPPLPASTSAGAKSDYQKQKFNSGSKSKPGEQRKNCRGCGKPTHSAGRRKECPAFNKSCTTCGRVGHFNAVCEQVKHTQTTTNNANSSPEEPPSSTSAVSSSLSWVFAASDPTGSQPIL